MRAIDETSFRELFDSTYSSLVAYARRRSSSAADADDVVGEVYAVAWRRRHDLDPEMRPLPWLYGIAGNVLRSQWRAGDRRLRLVERLRAEPRHDRSAAAGEGADVREALGRLSFDDQEVLRLVAWEGLSHAEIGQVLGCSTNAVSIRLHRARQRLKAELAEPIDPEDPPSPREETPR